MEFNKYAMKEFISDSDNFGTIFDLVSDINGYDGSLEFLNYQYNDDEFFQIYFGINVIEAVRAVCYGDYTYTDEFVRFDAYGNLESANKYEIMAEYNNYSDEIIEKTIEVYEACEMYLELPEVFFLN